MLGTSLAVFAIVIVCLSAGLVPGLVWFGSAPPAPMTEAQALVVASSIVSSTPGGPWGLVYAVGESWVSTMTFNLTSANNVTSGLEGGATGNFSAPALPSGYRTGVTNFWTFGFEANPNSPGFCRFS